MFRNCGGGYNSGPFDYAKQRSDLRRSLFGGNARCLPGIWPMASAPSKSIDDNFSRFREVWPPIVKYAEQKNVKIGIENCPMLFTNDEWPGGKNLALSAPPFSTKFRPINE